MGFLLGLEHANLTMMSSKNGSRASSRKSSLEVGEVSNGSVHGKVNSHALGQNSHLNVTHTTPGVWMKEVGAVCDIQCRLHPQFCDEFHDCPKTHNSEIRQRLRRSLSKLSVKWHFGENSSAKIDKTTSEVVTGLRYSVDYDAEDRISGRSSSSLAINSLGRRSPQDSSVVNTKSVQRASI